MIREWFSVPPFQPRATSPTLVIWADLVFMLPAYVIWAVGALLVVLAFRGYALVAVILLPFWAATVLAIAKRVHRAGRIRLHVSLGATVLVLAMATFVCLWF